MTDEPQHTTDNARATDQTDDAQTESETGNGEARLDAVEQRVEDHQAVLDGLKDHLGGVGDGIGPVATRRGVLTAGGVLGLLGLGAGTASGDPSGQIGTSNDPLQNLYTEELNGGVTGDKSLTNIAGSGLSIDNSGNLKTTSSNKWTDGSSGSSWLEPSDSGDTKVEGIDTILSNDQDSALRIRQDTNSNTGGAKDLIIETTDSGGSQAGNIVLSADVNGNNSNTSIDLQTDATTRAVVDASGLDVQAGTVENSTGALTLSTSRGNLALSPSGDINASSNNLYNVASIGGGGSAIGVDDPLNLSGPNNIQASGTDAIQLDSSQNVTVANGDLAVTPSSDSTTTLDVQDKDGNSVLAADTSNHKVQVFNESEIRSLDIEVGLLGGIISSSSDLTLSPDRLVLSPSSDIELESDFRVYNNKIKNDVDDIKIEVTTNGQPNTVESSKILLDAIEAQSVDTANIELNPGSNNGDVQVTNGTLDVQTGTVQNTTGGLTVTTNDNGNLILDPGASSSNTVKVKNRKSGSSGDNLLAVDGSDNLTESSKTVSDIGGKWQDGSDNSNLLEPSDGTKTGIEDVTQIRSNGSLTVDIDADNNSTSETFVIQSNTDSGSADTLVKVFEYGAVQIPSGSLDLQGNDLDHVNSLDNQGSAISFFDDIDMGPYAIQSTTADSTLTITQDSNSSDATPEDLILETKDSSANNAVGDIVFDADTDNASPADIVFKTSQTERARVNGSGLNVDNLTDNGTGSVTMGNTLDLNANDITNTNEITTTTASVGTLDNDGSAISVDDPLNLSNSDSIQDSGTDAIQFDGSQNVTLPNGTLDVQGSAFGSGVIRNSTDTLSLRTSNSYDLFLNPDGSIRTAGNKILGLVEDVVIETETDNNSSADTKKILLTGTESDSSDTANIELSPGSNNGDVQVTNGTLDVQTGTVQNTTGALTLSTSSSSDLDLKPDGDIDANGNTINNVASIDNGGSAISVDGALNLSGPNNIQASGTDAIQLDSSQNVTVANGDLAVTPSSDSTTTLDVQDKDGNSVLAADTSNHEVQVFDGNASDSVDISHGGTDGSISTSTGDLKLSPSGKVDINGNDIKDSGTTVYSTANGHVPRGQVDTDRGQTSTSSDYTVDASDETILVDASSNSVEINLPDLGSGHSVRIIDITGSAGTNTILIRTAGGPLIRGPNSQDITTDYGYREYEYNGSTDWYEVASN